MMRRTWMLVMLFAIAACSPQAKTGREAAPEQEAWSVSETGPDAKVEMEVHRDMAMPKLSSEALQRTLQADPEAASRYRALAADIETIIPRDAIPAIDEPRFWSADEADAFYAPDERVIGVDLEGEQRAYSVPFLSGIEVVNDEMGGRPISVTW